MGLKEDLASEVKNIFQSQWATRDGTVVPSDESLKLGNDAVKLSATVLYADLADSTVLVDSSSKMFAAEVYKTFLHCAAKLIRNEGADITAYDGDRVMAVYVGDNKNTRAVRTAMRIRWAVREIVQPALKAQYSDRSYVVSHVTGIDTSDLWVARTGIRGSNDLVWVGRAANYAAKLAALPDGYTYVTQEVYNVMNAEVKLTNGKNIWDAVHWNTFDNRVIHRSSWQWAL